MGASGSRTKIAGSLSSCIAAVSLVSSNLAGSHNHSARLDCRGEGLVVRVKLPRGSTKANGQIGPKPDLG